jgi:hypothetical protein
MATVCCPDCNAHVLLPTGAKAGDIVECPNCAGHGLRLKRKGEHWVATLAY